MTKMKGLAISATVVIGSFFMAPAVFAHGSTDHSSTAKEANTTAQTITDQQRAATFKTQFEDRKKELQQQVQEKKAEIKEKLSDTRKKVCEKRQVNINKIITNSNAQGASNLAVFQSIQGKVMQFVTDKNLTVANYEALVADADAKRGDAQAAFEVARQTTFSCDNTDPSSPGKVVSDLMHTKHDALKDYRTAVKNLIVAVKQAADDKTKTESEQ